MRAIRRCASTRHSPSWPWTGGCSGTAVRRLVNRHPTKRGALFLSVLPFILLVSVYLASSNARLAANPGDKLLPSPATLAHTLHHYAFEQDERSGDILFWADTSAS